MNRMSRPIVSRRRSALALGMFVATVFCMKSQAQTIHNNGTDRAQVQLGFVGNVRNSIILTLVGTGTTAISSQVTSGMPTHASGTIDFGSFSTQLAPPPANGKGYRVSLPEPGAVAEATVDAIVTYNGATSASLTVARQSPAGGVPSDVPLADLRVASPAAASWTSGAQGAQVPDAGVSGYDLCIAAGDATCLTGKPYSHSLAVFIPDTRAAGPFSTVVVYTGTMP